MDSNSKEKQIRLKQKPKISKNLKDKASLNDLDRNLQNSPKNSLGSFGGSSSVSFQEDSKQKPQSKTLSSQAKPHFKSKAKILSSLKKNNPFLKSSAELKEDTTKEFKKKEELLKLRAEKAESEFLYLRAEFENYKKRVLEEKHRLIRYSGESFISELATEVLDDLERALFASQDQKTVEDLQKGLQMIDKKLKKLFEKFGVQVLDPKGELFDPSYQEALSYVENSDLPEDQVVETYKKAYKLYDKVIRPAQVLVSKKDSKGSV